MPSVVWPLCATLQAAAAAPQSPLLVSLQMLSADELSNRKFKSFKQVGSEGWRAANLSSSPGPCMDQECRGRRLR